ncbi:hypothetical protein Tco_0236477 [Tanacetum coccineum]
MYDVCEVYRDIVVVNSLGDKMIPSFVFMVALYCFTHWAIRCDTPFYPVRNNQVSLLFKQSNLPLPAKKVQLRKGRSIPTAEGEGQPSRSQAAEGEVHPSRGGGSPAAEGGVQPSRERRRESKQWQGESQHWQANIRKIIVKASEQETKEIEDEEEEEEEEEEEDEEE